MNEGTVLTLDEAIKHCEEIASDSCKNDLCSANHKQLAEWLKDYSVLLQAKAENRLVILPSKSDEIIRIVERALHIKLYDWQKAYITGVSDYVAPGRVSGKTTAYMVKLCLSKGEPIDLTKRSEAERYADEYHGHAYPDWFKSELWNVHYELERIGGLRLRTIIFAKPKMR